MQQRLGLFFPDPTALPPDLALLLKDVPPEQLTGKTETEFRDIVDEPLVRAALQKFTGRIIDISTVKSLEQPELF